MSPTVPSLDRTNPPQARGLCIHELIEAQVDRTPHAPALVAGTEILSYRELNQHANALAVTLRGLGVGPDAIVGVYLQRSPAMIIGILATLKAGGAYLPMDPASPTGRLAELPVSVILSQPSLAARLPPTQATVVELDPASRHPAAHPNLGRLALPANLAYVIYTSGSTGTPKGVAVEHRSLVSSTRARIAFYPAPRGFLLLSAVAFDSAMAGIFGTLTQGGALCLPPAGVETDPREIARLIADHHIDAVLALPSLYELLLESAHGAQLASLRTVTVAGERCPPRLVTKSRTLLPTAELVNEYGPTEGTIWSTAWRTPTHAAAPPQTTVPIGRPVDGVRVCLRDASGQQVPLGETGELCISGAGVARGYLGRPDLTAAGFVADPAGPPGGRLYRTGDLARQRPDGEIEFVGRMDRQLKIRGFRIEPAEIEEAILRLAGVRQAAVMESPRAPGAALAAFVTGDGLTPAQVRQSLGDSLPAYMVPTEICLLEALPLTLTGKVDYRMLASILTQADGTPTEPPRSPTERVVAQLWREVLHRPRIARTDNFLDLGQSLDAMRIALQLSQLFKVEVPLLWVYEAPTVQAIAQLLESMVANASSIADTWLATHDEARSDGCSPRGDDDHDEESRG